MAAPNRPVGFWEPHNRQITCLKLILVVNGADRRGIPLEGGLTAPVIEQRISRLLAPTVNPSDARFVDLLWATSDAEDDCVATLDLSALASSRLAPLLSAPPGEADLERAGLLRRGDTMQGTPDCPIVTLDVQAAPARLPPRTPRAVGSHTTFQPTPRPGQGSAARPSDSVPVTGNDGCESEWREGDDVADVGGKPRAPPCLVAKVFGNSFKTYALKYWVCVDKAADNANKSCTFMNKEDFERVAYPLPDDHASRLLLRAVYGGALLETVQTVGPSALLRANLANLNRAANNASFRYSKESLLPSGRDDKRVLVWGMYKNFTAPFKMTELEKVWKQLWDQHAAHLDEKIKKMSRFCAGNSITMSDVQVVIQHHNQQFKELPRFPKTGAGTCGDSGGDDTPSPSAAAKLRHKAKAAAKRNDEAAAGGSKRREGSGNAARKTASRHSSKASKPDGRKAAKAAAPKKRKRAEAGTSKRSAKLRRNEDSSDDTEESSYLSLTSDSDNVETSSQDR